MKNFYLAIKNPNANRYIPILWASAKTYYEENSRKVDEWTWSDPWLTFDYSVEEILQMCKENPPDVFGFSVYIWNEIWMDELAQEIKKQYPNCAIVYGGPQVTVKHDEDFFKTHHWVDAVCPSDGYGEIIIKEILDNYPISNWDDIPYVWYTNDKRERLSSSKTIEKKSFKWPSNIYKAQEKYFEKHAGEIEFVAIETTRGCPYKCIYCAWGGGTYTKLVSKPYTTVLDEIEWIAKNKIPYIGFLSANFGILAIDVDIAEYCVEMKKQHGFPKYIHFETAKNNVERVGKIQEIWVKAGMLNNVKISVQTIDEEIKNNIERIDPPIEKQVANVRKLQAINPDIPIKIETIMGLPGDSYNVILEQFDKLFDFKLPMPRHNVWVLLPDSPAYAKEMRDKFKIGVTNGIFITHPFTFKSTQHATQHIRGDILELSPKVEMVVETYSFTRSDFVDMYVVSSFALALEYLSLQDTLMAYMKTQHGMKASELMDFIYSNYIKVPENFNSSFLETEFKKLYKAQYDCTHDLSKDNYVDFHPDFPMLLAAPNYIGFLILQATREFLDPICLALAKKFNDNKIIDLGNYIANSLLDLSYNPDNGREFNTDFNWLEYFSSGSELQAGDYQYKISDTEIYLNTSMQKIDWHLYQHNDIDFRNQFAVKQILETSSKVSKTIARIDNDLP